MNHAFAALGSAIGCALAQWRPVLILWLLGIAAAASISAPWEAALDRSLTHLPQSTELLGQSSVDVFLDLLRVEGPALEASRAHAARLSVVWILIASVLMTGLAARMHDRAAHKSWLGAAGRFGFRSVLLSLMTLGALALLVPLNNWISGWLTDWLAGDAQDTSARTLGWALTLKTLLMFGLAGIVVTSGQIARVRVVARDEKLAPLSWLRSLFMLLGKPVRVGLATVGVARVLSLVPLVVLLWLYEPQRLASLVADDAGLLGVFQPRWRAFVLLQGFQLALLFVFAYRLAVVVKLWPAIAPPAPAVAVTPAPEAPAAPAAAPTAPAPVSAAPADPPASAEGPGSSEPPRSPFVKTVALLAGLSLALGGPRLHAQQDEHKRITATLEVQQPASTPAAAPGRASDSRPTLRAEYSIDAEVDMALRSVSADERATFLNTTDAPVTELWMHLYATAFANTQTIWQDGRGKIARRTEADGGTLELRGVRLVDGTDIADWCTIEDTLLHVELPDPIAPGGSLALELSFVTRFPRIIARMGSQGVHLDGMQWFPKFAVHDADGWQANPFYGSGEFFSDFGGYEVRFRYPTEVDGRRVEFEATGIPGERVETAGGVTTVTYTQDDVHDFAFCADAAAIRFEDSATLPSGREVAIIYLCQPYATPKAERLIEAMKSFLRDSAAWWMEYPYDRIVVDGLPHNRGGGMEYPMLFTTSQTQPNHLSSLVELFEDPISVTAHEYGHQYWYGIMASNEVDEAWLDEGFNSWGTAKLEEGHFGVGGRTGLPTLLDRALTRDVLNGAWRTRLPFVKSHAAAQHVVGWTRSPFHDLPPDDARKEPTLLGFRVPGMDTWHLQDMQADRMAWLRTAYANDPDARPLDTASRDFTRGYGGLVYRKTALVLETLGRLVGAEQMQQIMRTYVERHRFGHPTKDDFLAVVSELSGGAHDVWLRAAIETDDTLDVAVEDAVSRERVFVGYTDQRRPGDPVSWVEPEEPQEPEAAPFWRRWWDDVFVVPFPGTAADTAETADAPDAEVEAEPAIWLHRWVVRRHGNLPLPVEVEARFADGSVFRDTWIEPGGYKIYEMEGPSALLEVRVDPDRKLAIDLNRLNDGRRREADHITPAVLGEHARFWSQTWLNGWLLAF